MTKTTGVHFRRRDKAPRAVAVARYLDRSSATPNSIEHCVPGQNGVRGECVGEYVPGKQ